MGLPILERTPGAGSSFLEAIVASKRIEVEEKRAKFPLEGVRRAADAAPAPRDFNEALRARIREGRNAVIAEFKRASPSRGILRDDLDPVSTATSYERGGAACMSVLTDRPWFGAQPLDLERARGACSLPVLRKDFVVDAYQVYESRAMGADCVLLIAACLSDEQLAEFYRLADRLGMAVIVEVHDRQEVLRAMELDTPLIGINSRNLHSFDVSLDLIGELGVTDMRGRLPIAESGITDHRDVLTLRKCGINAFLVGEALIRATDPSRALCEMVHAV
jgi:indole-3-glycerol phosphate synthase